MSKKNKRGSYYTIRSKFFTNCGNCKKGLDKGSKVRWNPVTKKVICPSKCTNTNKNKVVAYQKPPNWSHRARRGVRMRTGR